MAWAKIDDSLTFHPKIVAAGNEAVGIWVRMLAHCAQYLTDGDVSESVVRTLVGRYQTRRGPLARLLASGLCSLSGGIWSVHDYLEYNPSRAEVLAKREKERLRKGGKPREIPRGSGAASEDPDPTRPDPTPSDRSGNGSGLMLGEINSRLEDAFGARGFISSKWQPKLRPHLPYTPDEVESAIMEARASDPDEANGGLVASILIRYRRTKTRGLKPARLGGKQLPHVKPLERPASIPTPDYSDVSEPPDEVSK